MTPITPTTDTAITTSLTTPPLGPIIIINYDIRLLIWLVKNKQPSVGAVRKLMVIFVPTLVEVRVQEYVPVSVDCGLVNTRLSPTWVAEEGNVRPGRVQMIGRTLLTLEEQLSCVVWPAKELPGLETVGGEGAVYVCVEGGLCVCVCVCVCVCGGWVVCGWVGGEGRLDSSLLCNKWCHKWCVHTGRWWWLVLTISRQK